MGVDHVGDMGDSFTPEFGVRGDTNANCPRDFVMCRNAKHQIVCITMQ